MRIAQLASNEERVPPSGYGGTELVVGLLTDGLVQRGHKVTLFATGDSNTTAELVSVAEHPMRETGESARRWAAYDIRQLLELRRLSRHFDVIHNHMGWQALPYLEEMDCAVVTTNHNPIKEYAAPIYLNYKHQPFVSISNAYQRFNYPGQINYVATIYNGIDSSKFRLGSQCERSYLLFIGRLSEDKGAGSAIEIARRLNLPIVLAGKIDAADQAYFEAQVKPYLNLPGVTFLGEVGQDQKIELYSGAIATVYPVHFEEPFGLVMAESLAAGTPVMAFDRGSVRELLSDGETALIGKTADDLVNRYAQLKMIKSEICQSRVETLFSKERMVESYEQLYKQLLEV